MRDTIQVVAHTHTQLVSDLRSRMEDAEKHVGRIRTQSKGRGTLTVNGASQGRQLGWKPEPGTVTLMLRGRKLRH